MNSVCVKTFVLLTCLSFGVQLIQGAPKCVRTNTNPNRHCTDECFVNAGCSRRNKKCVCDGDCGYSCVGKRLKCSRPRSRIRNGKLIYRGFRFGDTQRTICNPGFKLTGSAVRTCRGNGFWDGKKSRCKKPQKYCKDPGAQIFVRRDQPLSSKGFKPNANLYYYCPPKFILKGSKILKCGTNGKWNAPPPTCEEPKCTPPKLPSYTYVIRPKNWKKLRAYGSRLSLGCNPGYTTARRGSLVCVTPGWNIVPSNFKCFPKSCADPGRPRHGDRKGQFTFGQKVHFTCDKCYKLKGPSYRQCLANQRWSDTQPTCERAYCGRPQAPRNGFIALKSLECGSTTQYKCDYGYKLVGPSSRTCQSDETWSGQEPTCVVNTCPDPGSPYNGKRTGSFLVGEKVNFSCNKCFGLIGQNSRKCLLNKKWSGTQPRCERIRCKDLSNPSDGAVDVKSSTCEGKAVYSCNVGYTLRGPSSRTCESDGKWNGTEPTCDRKRTATKVRRKSTTTPVPTTTSWTSPTAPSTLAPTFRIQSSCGYPSLPPEANISVVKTNRAGKLLYIGCKIQYYRITLGVMFCKRGGNRWQTIKPHKCLRKGCSNPGVPRNGFKQGLSYLLGATVSFICHECYKLVGPLTRTCLQGGKWSGTQPKCVIKSCPPPRDTKDATAQYFSTNCGAIAKYKCKDPHHKQLGSGEKKCSSNGLWSGEEPKCIDETNIALKKPAKQSSKNWNWPGPASRAVDGNRNPNYFRTSSCTHTKWEKGPWWTVDLQKEDTVAMVVVVNRKNCCHKRLNNFQVRVGNKNNGRKNALCGGKANPGPGEVVKIACPHVLNGRYVTIALPGNKYQILTLCEVEVYRNAV